MDKYTVGQELELEVVGLKQNSIGDYYIEVRDEDTNYRIFNILKCQMTGLPEKMFVVVRSVDAFGRVKVAQNTQRVICEHYLLDKLYRFSITDIKEDRNGHPYYLIEDDFAEHWFYYHGEQKHQIGDDICLQIKGADDKGFLKFEEYVHRDITPSPAPDTTPAASVPRGTNSVNYGPESKTIEYKTSIVFDPKTHQPDIASQCSLIVAELVAMMNTEGGKLIIGVRDSDQVVTGIEKDYPYLNDDDSDSYTYHQTEDHYKLKILNKLNYLCPTMAGSLVEFDFKEKMGKRYLVISVERSPRPIWLRAVGAQGALLYIRQDGRLKKIWGEELTEFIFRRMKESVDAYAGGAQAVAQLDTDKLEEILRRIINEKNHHDIQLPPAPQKEIDYWVVWETDGSWRRQNEMAASCYMQVPFYKGLSNPTLVFCYGNTRVVTMEWKKVRHKVNLNKVQGSLWNKAEKPTNIFIADINDLLLIRSLDHNGVENIKLHALTDFSPVEKGGAQGSPILPGSTVVNEYALLDALHLHAVNGLICTKADRSKTTGTPTTTASPVLAKQIAYIEELLKS